jgi:Domain of unknown function (DUF3846)
MPEYNGLILGARGGSRTISPLNGKHFTLEELNHIVGGHIEIVSLASGEFMVLNEEGKIKQLPYNQQATDVFMQGGRWWFDPVCGDVLVCKLELLEPAMDEDDDEDDLPF